MAGTTGRRRVPLCPASARHACTTGHSRAANTSGNPHNSRSHQGPYSSPGRCHVINASQPDMHTHDPTGAAAYMYDGSIHVACALPSPCLMVLCSSVWCVGSGTSVAREKMRQADPEQQAAGKLLSRRLDMYVHTTTTASGLRPCITLCRLFGV